MEEGRLIVFSDNTSDAQVVFEARGLGSLDNISYEDYGLTISSGLEIAN